MHMPDEGLQAASHIATDAFERGQPIIWLLSHAQASLYPTPETTLCPTPMFVVSQWTAFKDHD